MMPTRDKATTTGSEGAKGRKEAQAGDVAQSRQKALKPDIFFGNIYYGRLQRCINLHEKLPGSWRKTTASCGCLLEQESRTA